MLRAAHDLDQRHLRHGVEEVQADEPPGSRELRGERLEHDARSVGGEEGGGLHARLEARVQLLLRVGVLEDGLDDDVRVGHAVRLRRPARRRSRASARLRGILQALLEQLVRALERGLDEFEPAILQRDVEAAQRAPGGDVAAHDARADDVHVLHGRRAFAAQGLQPILQQEHAHEIARGLAGEQMRDRARFGFERLLAARAVIAPTDR